MGSERHCRRRARAFACRDAAYVRDVLNFVDGYHCYQSTQVRGSESLIHLLLSFSSLTTLATSQVVELDQPYRERVHAHQLRTYFYGTPLFLPPVMQESDLGGDPGAVIDMTLAPYSSIISFDDLDVYRVGGGAFSLSPLSSHHSSATWLD